MTQESGVSSVRKGVVGIKPGHFTTLWDAQCALHILYSIHLCKLGPGVVQRTFNYRIIGTLGISSHNLLPTWS